MEDAKEISVSVIIPTFNRANILEKTVRQLVKDNIQLKYEILIVDNNSDKFNKNKYKLLVKQFKDVHLFFEKNPGPAAARNLGIREAKGNILVFINDDTEVGSNFLKNHFDFHLRNIKINAGVIGPFRDKIKNIDNAAIKWLVYESGQHFNYDKASVNGDVPWYYLWTCNMSLKRIFVERNKLFFDESFPTAAWEDIEFAFRAKNKGLKLYFDERLKAWHKHHFNLDEVMERFFSHGRGLYHLKDKLPNNFLPPLGNEIIYKLTKVVFDFSFFRFWKLPLVKFLKVKNIAPNWIMQILIIGSKIEGFEYEKSNLRY